jgi:hypothetical protein
LLRLIVPVVVAIHLMGVNAWHSGGFGGAKRRKIRPPAAT